MSSSSEEQVSATYVPESQMGLFHIYDLAACLKSLTMLIKMQLCNYDLMKSCCYSFVGVFFLSIILVFPRLIFKTSLGANAKSHLRFQVT